MEASGTSAYLTELLVHHPEDMETLDSAGLAPSDGGAAGQLDMGLEDYSLPEAYAWAAETGLDLREKMALLRRQYRVRLLELGTVDLAAGGSAFAMLKRWTSNAARCIASAQAIAHSSWMSEKAAPRRCALCGSGHGPAGIE